MIKAISKVYETTILSIIPNLVELINPGALNLIVDESNPIDKQSLITELAKYGRVKATIQALEQKNNELKNEVASLEAKKNEMNNTNHGMLSGLAYSKQITYYFKEMADSLRDEF